MAQLEVLHQKTARFAQIVERCGRPSVHLTWVDPKKDSALQRLISQVRIMTVHQGVRNEGADFGVVGLIDDPHRQILVFPKSLKRFAGKRIVGINYDLLAPDPVVTKGPAALRKSKKAARKEEKKKAATERNGRTHHQTGGVETATSPAPAAASPSRPEPPAAPLSRGELIAELETMQSSLTRRALAQARERLASVLARLRADEDGADKIA